MPTKKNRNVFLMFSIFFISLWLLSGRTAVCVPDGNEPNNSFDTASTLTKGTYVELTIDPYWSDYDYYKINLNVGENMSVLLWNMTQDLNLEVYDTARSFIAGSSNMGTTPDSVNLTRVSIPGYYYIRISPGSTWAWSYYALTITNMTEDDGFEDNDDISTATTLGKGPYENLLLADTDCYNISLSAGENLTAQVALINGYGSFDLVLYAPNGTEIQSMLHFSKGTLGNLVLRNALPAGLYSIKITPCALYNWGNYSFLLADANDDMFEDNDGFATATNLTKGGYYSNLALFDADFYNISLSANANISISLSRSTGSGRFNISLFDTDQTTELWYSNNIVSSGNVFIAHVPSSGNYSLRILAARGDAWGNYSLTLGDLSDDIFEHADSFATAQELNKSTTPYQNLMLFDADFYKVNLTYGQNVSIRCTWYSTISGSVNISLYAPDQTTLLFQIDNVEYFTGSYYGPTTVLVCNVQIEGFYYIKVIPNQFSFCSNYQINVWYAWDDSYENNDVVGSAKEIVKFMSYSLALFDDDYFKIYIDAGSSARVMLSRSYGSGTFGVSIYAPDTQTILNSTANIGGKGVGYTQITGAANAGYYIIKVRSYAGGYGNYTLLIGNVYTSSSSGAGIAGFPTEWVILWGSGCLMMIIVWNRKRSRKNLKEGV